MYKTQASDTPVEAERLDFQYLQDWSQSLNLVQELEQALDEAGLNT